MINGRHLSVYEFECFVNFPRQIDNGRHKLAFERIHIGVRHVFTKSAYSSCNLVFELGFVKKTFLSARCDFTFLLLSTAQHEYCRQEEEELLIQSEVPVHEEQRPDWK